MLPCSLCRDQPCPRADPRRAACRVERGHISVVRASLSSSCYISSGNRCTFLLGMARPDILGDWRGPVILQGL